MLIHEALFYHIINDPGLSALVGTRVYPATLPESPILPAITYLRVSGPRDLAHDGPTGLASARYQFDSWSTNFGEARRVADALRALLHGYRGPMGSPPVQVGMVTLENDIDRYEPDTGRYHVMLDFTLLYQEV